MFLPIPNACGTLTISSGALDNVITVDPGLYNSLADRLGVLGEDHTYISVGEIPQIEYLRVTSVSNIPNQVIVDRGIDATQRRSHAVNSPIRGVLTAAAMQDLVDQVSPPNVQITADLPLRVDNSAANQFHLSIDKLKLTSKNSTLVITGEYPEIDLSVNPTNRCS